MKIKIFLIMVLLFLFGCENKKQVKLLAVVTDNNSITFVNKSSHQLTDVTIILNKKYICKFIKMEVGEKYETKLMYLQSESGEYYDPSLYEYQYLDVVCAEGKYSGNWKLNVN